MAKRKKPPLLPLILYFCDEGYRRLNPTPPAGIDNAYLPELIKVAQSNKLSYYLAKKVVESGYSSHQLFQEVLEQGEANFLQQEETLRFVASTLKDIGEFLIIKSYKGLPYITADIDFMISEERFDLAVQALNARGAFSIKHHRIPLPSFLENRLERARGAGLSAKGLLDIDVYQDTTWTGWLCLDNEFIWRKPQSMQIFNVNCSIPDPETDLLLNLAHIIFCHGFIHLLDFIYINSLLDKELDFDTLYHEAEKYGWARPLSFLINRLKELRQTLYLDQEAVNSTQFPYLLPMNTVIEAYIGVARATKEELSSRLSHWLNAVLKIATIFVYR